MVTVDHGSPQSNFMDILAAEAELCGVSLDAYRHALRTEGHERRERMLAEPEFARRRAVALAMGPPNGIVATTDEADDVRALLAKASFEPGTWTEEPNLALLSKGRLVELVVTWCPDHADTGECSLSCPAWFQLRPVKSGPAIPEFLTRRGVDRYQMSEWTWDPVPFTNPQVFSEVALACLYPQVHHLFGSRTVPFFHEDGSYQTEPGLEGNGGWLGLAAGAALTDFGELPPRTQRAQVSGPDRPALEVSLAGRLLALTARGPWAGSFSQLAAEKEIAWTGSPRALSAAFWAAVAETEELHAEKIGRVGPTHAAGVKIQRSNAPTLPPGTIRGALE